MAKLDARRAASVLGDPSGFRAVLLHGDDARCSAGGWTIPSGWPS
jgi:hypothetical protein